MQVLIVSLIEQRFESIDEDFENSSWHCGGPKEGILRTETKPHALESIQYTNIMTAQLLAWTPSVVNYYAFVALFV